MWSAANSVMGQGVATGESGNSFKSEIVRGSCGWRRDAYFVNRNESNIGMDGARTYTTVQSLSRGRSYRPADSRNGDSLKTDRRMAPAQCRHRSCRWARGLTGQTVLATRACQARSSSCRSSGAWSK